MRNEDGNNSIIPFIGLLLIGFLSVLAISKGEFSQQTNKISNNKTFINTSLKDDYDNQKKSEQEELRKCRFLLANSQWHSDRYNQYVTRKRYFFDWENNTVLVFSKANEIPARCIYDGKYIMGKIYKKGDTKKQYVVEYSGKRGTLVKYSQYKNGNISRVEECDCIVRSSPY